MTRGLSGEEGAEVIGGVIEPGGVGLAADPAGGNNGKISSETAEILRQRFFSTSNSTGSRGVFFFEFTKTTFNFGQQLIDPSTHGNGFSDRNLGGEHTSVEREFFLFGVRARRIVNHGDNSTN